MAHRAQRSISPYAEGGVRTGPCDRYFGEGVVDAWFKLEHTPTHSRLVRVDPMFDPPWNASRFHKLAADTAPKTPDKRSDVVTSVISSLI
jgi:hypothetical protein